MKLRTIDVYANPYAAVDADGVPQAVVQMPGTRNYIGAFIDHVATRTVGKQRFYFTGEKTTVPFTAEIAKAVLEGSLIVADKEHSRMCGLAGFEEAPARLEKEKASALAERQARLGKEADLKDPPNKATEADPNAPAPNADLVLSGPKNMPSVVLKRGARGGEES